MQPEIFEGVNLTLTAPKGWADRSLGLCGDLPISQQDGVCVSCWSLTPEERRAVYDGAQIYVSVASGKTQPPISLAVDKEYLLKQEQTQ